MYTQFDVVALVTLLVFITISMIKGGIKSVLGIGKWYGAFFLALAFYPYTKSIVESVMQPSPIINGVAVFLVYIIALVILSLIIAVIIAALGNTIGGVFDRLLGVIVGLGLGYIIVSTIHFAVSVVHNNDDPSWLADGKTYQFTKYGSEMLASYFNDELSSMTGDLGIDMPDVSAPSSGNIPNVVRDNLNTGDSNINIEALMERARELKNLGYSPEEVKSIIAGQKEAYEDALINNPKNSQ
jgi:uncharacterized membrane protein required for colicin V production